MTDDDAGGGGKKLRFLDDVICEPPLTKMIHRKPNFRQLLLVITACFINCLEPSQN